MYYTRNTTNQTMSRTGNLLKFLPKLYTPYEGGLVMAGSLQINPLTKSYDELRRCKKRLQTYILMNKYHMLPETEQDIRNIISKLDQIINLIPEDYRLNSYEIRKEYKELRD